MSIYAIGEPRGNDQHPGSPNYDDSFGDAVEAAALDGSCVLRQAPCELMRALADLLDQNDANDVRAARELMEPLYANVQSAFLAKLRDSFCSTDSAKDVAALAIEREFAD